MLSVGVSAVDISGLEGIDDEPVMKADALYAAWNPRRRCAII